MDEANPLEIDDDADTIVAGANELNLATDRSTWSDNSNTTLDDEISFSEIHCDKCGYITAEQIDYGLHCLEYNNFSGEEYTFACASCKDDRSLVWGMETRELY